MSELGKLSKRNLLILQIILGLFKNVGKYSATIEEILANLTDDQKILAENYPGPNQLVEEIINVGTMGFLFIRMGVITLTLEDNLVTELIEMIKKNKEESIIKFDSEISFLEKYKQTEKD